MNQELTKLQEKEYQPVNLNDLKYDLQKKYLEQSELNIQELSKVENEILLSKISKQEIRGKIRFFKIEKFVYEKDVKITSKLKSVFTTLHSVKTSVIFKIVSDGTECSLYLGVKSGERVHEKSKVLKGTFEGNFPGTKFSNSNENLSNDNVISINNQIFNSCKEITAVVGTPSLKDKEEDQFIQGIENLILGMNGKSFSALFLADPVAVNQVDLTLDAYEKIYSILSSEKEFVVTEGSNDSFSDSQSISKSESTSKSNSTTEGSNESTTKNSSPWIGRKLMNGFFGTGSKNANYFSEKIENGLGHGITYGTTVVGGGLGTIVAGGMGGGFGALKGYEKGKELSGKLDLKKKVEGNKTKGTNHSETESNSKSQSNSESNTTGKTSGTSISRQKTYTNKNISNFLDQLDKQIERLEQGKGVGFWNTGVYFISDEEQNSIIAANIYNGVTKGAESNFETSTIKTFNSVNKTEKNKVLEYLQRYEVPRIDNYGFLAQAITTDELTVQMNLPHKSVVGLDVVEIVPFGNNPKKEVKTISV